MTKQRDFKKRVRARMAKTGERYATARARLLERVEPGAAELETPGVVPGYGPCGGIQTETSAMANVFRHAGLRTPAGTPYSEALIHGLCGGVGFLYGVFEYKGFGPTMTIVGRSRSMPNAYMALGLERCGARLEVSQTSSAAKARRELDAVLDAGRPALCTVDPVGLRYYGLPEFMAGMGPHVVAVIGRDGDDVWLDDRGVRPIRVSHEQLAAARKAYRQAKHHLVSLTEPVPGYELAEAVRDALRLTVRAYDEPPAKPFANNVGSAGLDKWARLLTDPKHKKGWAKVFAEGARAYVGLQRIYACTQHDYSAPDAGRPLYASYLDEAAGLTGLEALREVAAMFREAGELWGAISARVAKCGDSAVERACAIADHRAELLDAQGADAAAEMAALWTERRELRERCELDAAAARAIYAELAELVTQIRELERAAIDRLAGLVA